jgi:hypothetical protein
VDLLWESFWGFYIVMGMAGIYYCWAVLEMWTYFGIAFEVFTPWGWQAFINAGQRWSCGPALGELLGFLTP